MNPGVQCQEDTLSFVRRLPLLLEGFREMLLANLVMIGEIPAPTFHENQRIEFLRQRFTECHLQNCSTDDLGNGLGILPGSVGEKSILVSAHADTPFSSNINHTLSISPVGVTGPGVGDNSLGLAVLATLPTILERLEIRLRHDLVLIGATRTLGRGNLQGLRFFLANNRLPLIAGVSVEGVHFGRLNYASLASLNGEISCKMNDVEAATGKPSGAVVVLNRVITRLYRLPVFAEPHTTLILGSVEGGTAFKKPARSTCLRFQVRSETDEVLAKVEELIRANLEEVATETRAAVHFEVIARTNAGGLEIDHPLVLQTRRILAALGIQPREDPLSTTVSSFIERDIPAITIGITSGQNINEADETVAIEPMIRGVAQLIGILWAMDGGFRDRY
jgi:acetylornithine deacetylase/succinyl-diaminopimelate desuccinylase-like protein